MDRLGMRMEIAHRALSTLREACGRTTVSELERDGAIQRFQYSFEAVWRASQAWLEVVEGISSVSPKSVLRSLGEVSILSENETVLALAMAEDRNRTVHTYIEALAIRIFARLPDYIEVMQAILSRMEQRFEK